MTTNLTAEDRAELNRVWDDLTAAIRVIERLLGEDDPTGLRYSREDTDDEAEPAAPVREHYGFTVTGREQRPTNSPAGYASTDRRARRCNPAGGQLSADGGLGGPAAGMGTALLGGRAVPTLRGGGLR